MKAVYVDSSVLVALLLRERGYEKTARFLEKRIPLFSSYLLEAELYATASREGISLETAGEFVDLVSLVLPDRSLKEEYRRIFEGGYCRGADACHVATALYLDPKTVNLGFLTADKDQAKIAKAVGFRLLSCASPPSRPS